MTMLWCSACMVLINLGRVMVHGVLHIEFCLSYSYHGPGELQRPKSQFKQDGAVDSGVTVQQFYDEKVVCKLSDELDLESAGLGKSKDSLDKIEMSLSLDSAIHMFGPFLRYYTCSRLQQLPLVRDAFALLMASQKQLSQAGLPACIPVRTKKDKLYNDFLGLLSEENMHFTTADVDSLGKIFVKTIVECLWYVDGHHEKLKRQSAPIPDYFGRFTGYNLPELSKHRKRQHTNLSSSILKSLSSSLFQNLQASFWNNVSFRQLQKHTQLLAQSMANYSDYLSSQNKTMKNLHAQPVPVIDSSLMHLRSSMCQHLLQCLWEGLTV